MRTMTDVFIIILIHVIIIPIVLITLVFIAFALTLALLPLADTLSDAFALLLQVHLLHTLLSHITHPMSCPILAHACQLRPSSLVCTGGCRKRLRSMKVKSSKS